MANHLADPKAHGARMLLNILSATQEREIKSYYFSFSSNPNTWEFWEGGVGYGSRQLWDAY